MAQLLIPQVVATETARIIGQRKERVLDWSDLGTILRANRDRWSLPKRLSLKSFVAHLIEHSELQQVTLDFPNRSETRFTWGELSIYPVLMTLHDAIYLSHYSALYIHQLTEQEPKSIYLNREQAAKKLPRALLAQDRIDMAFKNPVRKTNTVAVYRNQRIYLLNGKATGNLGVTHIPGSEGFTLRVTDLERTLIDIAVRPEYSGGVTEVVKAYRNARKAVSINRLVSFLMRMDFVYPYHQAIGFYLERADSYSKSQISLLSELPMKHDFYLTHAMSQTEYSERWRIFYPKGL